MHLQRLFVCIFAQDDLLYQVPFQELMVRISYTQMILYTLLYKVHETSASCTTCLSVYVNLIKERLSFCAFYITAECSKPFGQTPSFSKASAKVHTFYQSTKCF